MAENCTDMSLTGLQSRNAKSVLTVTITYGEKMHITLSFPMTDQSQEQKLLRSVKRTTRGRIVSYHVTCQD